MIPIEYAAVIGFACFVGGMVFMHLTRSIDGKDWGEPDPFEGQDQFKGDDDTPEILDDLNIPSFLRRQAE